MVRNEISIDWGMKKYSEILCSVLTFDCVKFSVLSKSLALWDLQWEGANSASLPLLGNKFLRTLLVLSFKKTHAPKVKRRAHYFDDATKLWIWLLIKTLFLTIYYTQSLYLLLLFVMFNMIQVNVNLYNLTLCEHLYLTTKFNYVKKLH